jgi:hypothetical protein
MLNFLRGKKKPLIIPDNVGFDENEGTFSIVYERKAQPDFGALEYALESLALPPMPVLGAGTGYVRTMVDSYPGTRQLVATQNVVAAGVPLVAGFIYGQPLLDVDGQYYNNDVGELVIPDKVLAASYNAPFVHRYAL